MFTGRNTSDDSLSPADTRVVAETVSVVVAETVQAVAETVSVVVVAETVAVVAETASVVVAETVVERTSVT